MLRAIILIIAIGAGGLAGWLVLSSRSREAAVAPAAPIVKTTVEILVASGDLVQGQPLEEKSMRWQSWPKELRQPRIHQPRSQA